MSLAIPYSFIGGVGNKARASEVNANFQAVAAKFTEGVGGIADGDISSIAAIKGTKLSNVAGNRVPTDRIEDNAVDATKLRSDATAGSPSAGVGSASNIKDRIITAVKIAAGVLTAGELKITTVTQAISLAVTTATQVIAVTPAPALPAMTAMLPLRCTCEGMAGQPITGIAAAVQDAGGVTKYIFTVQGTGIGTATGTVRFTYLALT